MRIAQNFGIGAWLLIGLNLLMAFGAIWIFTRMAPAIAVIIEQNERTLEACEEMLASLAANSASDEERDALKASFSRALQRANANITEKQEPIAIRRIRMNFEEAFAGNEDARKETVSAILLLSRFNRQAMITADKRAQQLGSAGAWGVVFMAASVFFAGMAFKRSLLRKLIYPLEEINSVLAAHQNGDTLRRCTGTNLPADIKTIFNDLNELLDKMQSR